MNWLGYLALTTIFFAAYDTLMKLAGDKIHYASGSIGVTIGLLLVSIPLFAITYARLGIDNMPFTKAGIGLSVLAGVVFGIANLFYLLTFSKSAPLSVAMPILGVGVLIITMLIGIFIMNEGMNIYKVSGGILGILAILLLMKGA